LEFFSSPSNDSVLVKMEEESILFKSDTKELMIA